MGKIKPTRNLLSETRLESLYTGREEMDKSFLAEIHAIDEEILTGVEETPYHVMNNFGIGGIGKTTIQYHLIEKIIAKENASRKKPIKYLVLDFDQKQESQNEHSLVLKMIESLRNKYNLDCFVCTMCALYKQSMVTGESFDYRIETTIDKVANSKATKLAVAFLKAFPGFSTIIDLAQDIDGIIRDPKNMSDNDVLRVFEKAAENISVDSLNNVRNIIESSTKEIEDNLIYYFAQDLRTVIIKQEAPFVFFIDTYEKQINVFNDDNIALQGKEKWLLTLIEELPYSLWIIAGREDLKITKSKNWNKTTITESNKIKAFTDLEIKEYLRRAKIPPALDSLFIKLSNGIPFILDMLRRIYLDLEEKKENVYDEKQYMMGTGEDIGKKVIERYRNRMDPKTKKLISQLSEIEGGWDEETIDAISNEIEGFDEETYNRLITTSLFSITEEGKIYIPESIRQAFLSEGPSSYTGKTRKAFIIYLCQKVIDQDIFSTSSDFIKLLTISTKEERRKIFYDFGYDKLAILINNFRLTEAKQVLDFIKKDVEDSKNILYKSQYLLFYGKYCLNKGDYENSYTANKKCYEIRLEELGEKDPNTLLALNNLADCIRCRGDYKDAFKKDQLCYLLRAEILGENHLETIRSLMYMANDLRSQGNFSEACVYAKKAYWLCHDKFGEKHPQTLFAMNEFILNTMETNNNKALLNDQRKCYSLFCEVFGEKEISTITVLSNLAQNLSRFGEYQESLDAHSKCYKAYCEMLGEKHPNSIVELGHTAFSLFECGNYNDSLQMSRNCYQLSCEVFGEKHPKTRVMMNRLGIILRTTGNFKEAFDLDKRDYAIACEEYGEENPLTIRALNNLALDLQNQGEYDKALSAFEKCYQVNNRFFGPKHQETITTLDNMASCMKKVGNIEKALSLHEKCLNLRIEILGEKHTSTLYSLNNVADDLRLLGKHESAFMYDLICYELFCEQLGEKHPDTLISLNNLSTDLENLGDYQSAINYNTKNYNLCLEVLGEKDPTTLAVLNNLALNYSKIENYEVAISLLYTCYNLHCDVFGDTHPDTVMVLQSLNDTIEKYEEYKEKLDEKK